MSDRIGWRPLLAGVGIVPSSTGRWATAGLYFACDGRDWLLTALHALGNVGANPLLQVWQGPKRTPPWLIAECATDRVRTAPAVDAAAVPLLPALVAARETVCLGEWAWPPRPPQLGERVAKVGSATGMSVGRVQAVSGGHVSIECLAHYPNEYALSEAGDSGAVWMALLDRKPVALHQGLQVQSRRVTATTLEAVFAGLQISPMK